MFCLLHGALILNFLELAVDDRYAFFDRHHHVDGKANKQLELLICGPMTPDAAAGVLNEHNNVTEY